MNKNGWGLRVELAFLLLFLICLLIATIGLHRMGLLSGDGGVYTDNNGTIRDDINYDYNSLEKRVTEASNRYYDDVYSGKIDDTVVVSTSTLKANGYLTSITDSRGKECKGYSIIMKSGNIVSYIRCSVYKTVGYNEEYE